MNERKQMMEQNGFREEKTGRADTIAAVATAPGLGGIGIVRISGPEAEDILRKVFVPASGGGRPMESHRLTLGTLRDGEREIDQCMAVLMRAPRSYTREDVAELQVHGGGYVAQEALSLCLRKGARLAGPGEFTRRAFLNGRIDLSQAEAVMRLISARGQQQHRAAMRQLEGGAARFVRAASDQLYDLQAGIAACIDYPEEVTEEEGTEQLREGLNSLIRMLRGAVDERGARLIEDGLRVVLTGRPNVGKSSLLNALTGEDRAIVTSVPGTTRDVIHGEILLEGIRVTLTDTAGIRETDDPVEKIGVDRSRKAAKEAEMVLLVLDASEELTDEDQSLLAEMPEDGTVILNKTDLPEKIRPEDIQERRPGIACIQCSAMEPESLEHVKELIREQVRGTDRLALTQPRHMEAIERAVGHLEDALRTAETQTLDLAATDLQAAQAALGEITGDQVDEKLLDRVFDRFCVGK